MTMRFLVVSAGYVLTLSALWWGTTGPAKAMAEGSATFDDIIALGAALAAWALSGWILLTMILSAVAAVPGQLGRASNWCADRVVPPSARRLAHVALGLAAVAAPLGAAVPAAAMTSPTQFAATAESPPARCASDGFRTGPIPGIGRPPVTPPSHRQAPSAEPESEPAAEPPATTGLHDPVVVEPGATLWSIAADHLGPDATPAEIAREWPRWFIANHEQIGTDPDVIQPGLRLSPPES
ncbi:LysM peptidoglycan-binding domain-containing protein [Phytoactinopolyspora mesophila]|uniref:LysM peptidoglycan-binding domain-containing protein n=1 Tax=Phytoactinopolyspora mesophila TaxID=2650750 RepID=A0A7K3M6R1_9ACTN|nr:LysM domain-containing protein [Phytoactinopolyspora mesophila]NDL58582.1 hypothetical protein [Phytoactinopolyspora mesophila]